MARAQTIYGICIFNNMIRVRLRVRIRVRIRVMVMVRFSIAYKSLMKNIPQRLGIHVSGFQKFLP